MTGALVKQRDSRRPPSKELTLALRESYLQPTLRNAPRCQYST